MRPKIQQRTLFFESLNLCFAASRGVEFVLWHLLVLLANGVGDGRVSAFEVAKLQHESHILGVDGDLPPVLACPLRVFEQRDEEVFSCALKRTHRTAREARVLSEVDGDFANQARKRQHRDQEFGGRLVLANLPQRHGAWLCKKKKRPYVSFEFPRPVMPNWGIVLNECMVTSSKLMMLVRRPPPFALN